MDEQVPSQLLRIKGRFLNPVNLSEDVHIAISQQREATNATQQKADHSDELLVFTKAMNGYQCRRIL